MLTKLAVLLLQVAADGAARAQAEAAVQRQEALASLEVARAELDKVQQQLALAQSAADKKGQEVRELNHMLKAWEAMRLGKDAQVSSSEAGQEVVADVVSDGRMNADHEADDGLLAGLRHHSVDDVLGAPMLTLMLACCCGATAADCRTDGALQAQ
jgi:hypothetical protein